MVGGDDGVFLGVSVASEENEIRPDDDRFVK
jgi:hypothetical protein